MEEKIEDILISIRSLKKEIKNTRHIFRLESIEKDIKMLGALHNDEINDLIDIYNIPELIMEDTNE